MQSAAFFSGVGRTCLEGPHVNALWEWPSVSVTVAGKAEVRRWPIVVQSGGGFMTIRSGRWKLVAGLGSGGFSEPARVTACIGDPAGQLYDLAADNSRKSATEPVRHPWASSVRC